MKLSIAVLYATSLCTYAELKSLAASFLTQAADKKK